MYYLIAGLWPYLFAAFALGLVAGWFSWKKRPIAEAAEPSQGENDGN